MFSSCISWSLNYCPDQQRSFPFSFYLEREGDPELEGRTRKNLLKGWGRKRRVLTRSVTLVCHQELWCSWFKMCFYEDQEKHVYYWACLNTSTFLLRSTTSVVLKQGFLWSDKKLCYSHFSPNNTQLWSKTLFSVHFETEGISKWSSASQWQGKMESLVTPTFTVETFWSC